jgi:hypothetical protein
MGNCGNTAKALIRIAGFPHARNTGLGRRVWPPEGRAGESQKEAITREIHGVNCNLYGCPSSCAGRTPSTFSCSGAHGHCTGEAMRFVAQRLTATQHWSDSVLDQLQPGDNVEIYNGNADMPIHCPVGAGQHQFTFMGWRDAEHKIANVVQGDANPRRGVNVGTQCLRSTCGATIRPVTAIYSPQE